MHSDHPLKLRRRSLVLASAAALAAPGLVQAQGEEIVIGGSIPMTGVFAFAGATGSLEESGRGVVAYPGTIEFAGHDGAHAVGHHDDVFRRNAVTHANVAHECVEVVDQGGAERRHRCALGGDGSRHFSSGKP